ncbi:MAG: ferritin family protein [Proteobacteria bacterium]|nr:ferritin family protein [Pseudomonadota bacterium]
MDPVHFTGKEIIEMAVRIEENGYTFYKDAAENARTEPLKALFSKLAEEERDHIVSFKDIKSSIPDDSPPPEFDPFIAEANAYLKSMADYEVFTEPGDGDKLPDTIFDEKQALGFAINMEKDSLLFYYELIKMVTDKDLVVVEKLIAQEKDHLRRLTIEHDNLFGE